MPHFSGRQLHSETKMSGHEADAHHGAYIVCGVAVVFVVVALVVLAVVVFVDTTFWL
jgi:uncharacterized protein YsxB (DUF464 family)